jgi:hypothetical protein
VEEFRSVLYKKFGMTKDEAEANIAIVREFSKLIDIPGTLRVVIEDPEDDKFVETALVAGAQWLVSGDKHLLRLGDYRGLKVISAPCLLGPARGITEDATSLSDSLEIQFGWPTCLNESYPLPSRVDTPSLFAAEYGGRPLIEFSWLIALSVEMSNRSGVMCHSISLSAGIRSFHVFITTT